MAQKQYLRDAEHLDFLDGLIDEWVEYVKKDMAEEGVSNETKDKRRAEVRRARLLQGNVRHNREETRKREHGGEGIKDEF